VAAEEPTTGPPPGEWDAAQVLGHVSIINAMTIAVVAAVASGTNTTYDNRIAQDTWTIGRVVELAGAVPVSRNASASRENPSVPSAVRC